MKTMKRFNEERHPSMDLVASIIGNMKGTEPNEKEQAQLEKLKMAGVYLDKYEVIKAFENGVKIVAFNSDGLIDKEEALLSKTTNTVYRVYGADNTSNKQEEVLSNKNFRIVAKCPYGLFELIRSIPMYSYGAIQSQYDGTEINICEHRVLFIREDGTVILNEAMHNPKEQFSTNRDWYYKSMKRMREPILSHIIEHGPERNKVGYYSRELISDKDYEYGDSSKYTFIRCENTENGKYQIAYMGSDDTFSFVLFDLKTGKCISTGNCVQTHYAGWILLLPDSKDSKKVICLNRKTGELYRLWHDTSIFDYISKEYYPVEQEQMRVQRQEKILSLKEKVANVERSKQYEREARKKI